MKFKIILVLVMAIVFGLTMGPPGWANSISSPMNDEATIMTGYPVNNISSATISAISANAAETMVSSAPNDQIQWAMNSANIMMTSVQNDMTAKNAMAFCLSTPAAYFNSDVVDGAYKTIAAGMNVNGAINTGMATTNTYGAFLSAVIGDSATATYLTNNLLSTIQPAFTDLSSALASNIDIGSYFDVALKGKTILTDNLEAVALTSLGGNMILKMPITGSVKTKGNTSTAKTTTDPATKMQRIEYRV